MFIALEGIDGSGKTSQMPSLVEFLCNRGFKVTSVREPGATPIGESIRNLIFDLKNAGMHLRTETLFYQAARAQIVEEVIVPRLDAGDIVISDRYADSTIAYQGYGYQQSLNEIRSLVKYATGGLMPDFRVLFDIAINIGLKRKAESKDWNRLDGHEFDFYQRVRDGYLEMAKQEPSRWIVIDASQKWESVQEELRKVIMERLEAK
jgi:dTMP kinase